MTYQTRNYLTPEESHNRDEKVVQYIIWYWEKYGFPPSIRSIGKAVGIPGPATTHEVINRLVRQKRIVRDPVNHKIRIVNNGKKETCVHDWRVKKIVKGIAKLICADCRHTTEAEYAPDEDTPLKDLLKYPGKIN